MPRHTQASSRGTFQFTQVLSTSSRKKKSDRLSLSPKRDPNLATRPPRSISTPLVPMNHSKTPSFLVNRKLPIMDRNHPFTPFNVGSPLILAQRDFIPPSTLKSLPFFTSETSISPLEHIKEVFNVCIFHSVIKDNFVVRLLGSSLKGKTL